VKKVVDKGRKGCYISQAPVRAACKRQKEKRKKFEKTKNFS
jgi:hypothetical protein